MRYLDTITTPLKVDNEDITTLDENAIQIKKKLNINHQYLNKPINVEISFTK